MKGKTKFLLFFLLLFVLNQSGIAQNIITLTWDDVIGISRTDNLGLRIQQKDYEIQNLNEWKAVSDLLPTFNYQYQIINNIERPVFVVPGIGEIRFGTEYNFTHVFQLYYPLFAGGARISYLKMQGNMKKSLSEQLKNKEDEVVLQALEAYFGVMLSQNLIKVTGRSKNAAEANFEQVNKFYELGAASQLDYLRAKSRYSSSIPPTTTARNNKKLALENLKFHLNIEAKDSLIVIDTLHQMEFLKDHALLPLLELKELALKERADFRSAQYQSDAVKNQKLISASKFLPTIAVSANFQYQAQVNSINVGREDFVRAKNAGLLIQFPLFQGGKRAFDYQQARISEKKAELQLIQFEKAIFLEVEESFNRFNEAKSNLVSLSQSAQEAKEALRLADLTYREGISTQVDVLGAQLALTNSEVEFQEGVYRYNVSQLRLLKAIGKLKIIWENN